MKRWVFRSGATGDFTDKDRQMGEKLGVHPMIVRLLRQRGITSVAEMDIFLSPNLRYLARPELWSGLDKAAAMLTEAVLSGKKIAIWGDYDADGVTAAVLALEVLAFHGVAADVHLPDRRQEGYGLNIPGIEALAADGIQILLTVDCGISDVAEIARAHELGMSVIVSDHHSLPEKLPDADAIVNPRLGDANPCPYLSGVGVAFFLMADVNTRLAERSGKKMDLRDVLDIVALGTVADLVPLVSQNRILVKNGLLTIAQAQRPGIAALKKVSGFSPFAPLRAGQVAFQLAPRINAAGRLGSPQIALQLLRARTHEEAADLAQELDKMNTKRREEEDRILQEASLQAKENADKFGLVLYGENWHQGVIGIVASNILEKMYRPVLILCRDGAMIKGSGRSIEEFDLYAGLCKCADLFSAFGGHKQAAGMQLDPANLDTLRTRFDTIVRESLGSELPREKITLDDELHFTDASDSAFLKALDLLQPFGIGNPEPVFASLPLYVRQYRRFGQTKKHVNLSVVEESSGISMQAKIWKAADILPASVTGKRMRIAFTPTLNAWNGKPNPELNVRDWEMLDNQEAKKP